MALFKIFNGKSENLGKESNTEKINEGFAYFTPDDGKFYIDILNEGEVDKQAKPVIGNYAGEPIQLEDGTMAKANRICINQKLFTYNDYDVLDCGTAENAVITVDTIIFNCGNSIVE